MLRPIKLPALLFGCLLLLACFSFVRAQAEDEDSLVPGRRKEPPPQSLQDTMSKMRIEKEKKTFNEMLKRGDDALKLAEELNGAADSQQEQIAGIGKLVKKVRDELGAEGPIDVKDETTPSTRSEAVKALKAAATGLSEELRKCTRFTVSASAIGRANEVLRLVRFLHG